MDGVYIIIVGLGLAFAFWHEVRSRKLAEIDAKNRMDARAAELFDSEVERLNNEKEKADAESELKQAVLDLLAIEVAQHKGTLSTKRRQGVVKDEYGMLDESRWINDQAYFIDRVCDPAIFRYYNDHCLSTKDAYAMIGIEIDALLGTPLTNAIFGSYHESMDGIEFERLVADKLRLVGAEVSLTPASGDHGADLIVRFNTKLIVVQCKRSASTIGNKAVQEVYAGCAFHDADQAWVVSDAPFSRHAQQLADSLSVKLIDISQIDHAVISLHN